MRREKTKKEQAECSRQIELLRNGDIEMSNWFAVFSDGEAMTIGREDTISMVGTQELMWFMEEL